jgi:serine/threonine protein kinase
LPLGSRTGEVYDLHPLLQSFSPSPETFGIDLARPPALRYRILGRIGAGGMAQIYLARMRLVTGGSREVALKRLRPELQTERQFVQMFYDEARIAAQMDHPNIVRIFELGELDGSLFLSMEAVLGVTLRDLVTRLAALREKPPLAVILRIACGALEGLAYAHRATDASKRPLNLVHRDMSPQNIAIGYQGEVKILDFGVAKAERRLQTTLPGLVKGKIGYMAPEQVRGGVVDARADLFAIGEAIYEAALLKHPFFASSETEVLRRIVNDEPTEPHVVDDAFPMVARDLIARALAKDPDDRFSSAEEMRDAIERILADQPASYEDAGRYVAQVFPDAFALLARAKEDEDDELLVRALRLQDVADRPPSFADYRRRTFARNRTPHYADLPTMPLALPSPEDINAARARAPVIDAMTTEEPSIVIEAPVFLEPVPFELSTGARIGRYRVHEHVGPRRWSELWRASSTDSAGITRPCTLVCARGEAARSDGGEALLEEGRRLVRFSHPHVIGFLEMIDDLGRRTLVLDDLGGPTLARALEVSRASDRPLSALAAVRIVRDLALALERLEAEHIVLAALTPKSIALTYSGYARIVGLEMPPREANQPRDPADVRPDVAALDAIFRELAPEHRPQDAKSAADLGRAVIRCSRVRARRARATT